MHYVLRSEAAEGAKPAARGLTRDALINFTGTADDIGRVGAADQSFRCRRGALWQGRATPGGTNACASDQPPTEISWCSQAWHVAPPIGIVPP